MAKETAISRYPRAASMPNSSSSTKLLHDLLQPKHPVVMGILNVTPDSFSDGGKFLQPTLAIEHARRLADEGADIIDIGAESTRPYGGAQPVSLDEERG